MRVEIIIAQTLEYPNHNPMPGIEASSPVDLQLMVFFTLGGRKIALFGRR